MTGIASPSISGEPLVSTPRHASPTKQLFVDWSPYFGHAWTDEADTTVSICHTLQGAYRARDMQCAAG